MRLKSVPTCIICLLLLTAAVCAGTDGNVPDTLYIESLNVTGNGPVAVKIKFSNDEDLAALTIPLALNGTGFKIDTVLYAESRVNYLRMRPITIAEDRQSIIFGAIVMTEAYISAGNGVAATLMLSRTDSMTAGSCVIDTTTMGPTGVLFTKISSESFIPVIVPGHIQTVDSTKTK